MHSSILRGTDFKVDWKGRLVTHAEFFSTTKDTDRIGIVIPNRLEGLGATTLIMAFVTAFYDRYRERESEFFTYPDYFTFQRQSPCADYCSLDIWPFRKNVHVSAAAQGVVEAITERSVNVLLVPDIGPRDAEIAPLDLESAQRDIHRCFAYSETGETESSDVKMECSNPLLHESVMAVLDSVPADGTSRTLREQWRARKDHGTIRQSFREIDLSEALRRI